MEPTWLALLELVLESTLKLLEVEEERVVMGVGVSFFCSPFKMCWPLTDMDISRLYVLFFAFSSSYWSRMQ